MNASVTKMNSANLALVINKLANDPEVDTERMCQVIEAQERFMKAESQKAFFKDMSSCQKAMPAITADAINNSTGSKFAKYETILETVKPIYTKHGFSLCFSAGESSRPDLINFKCEVFHKHGFAKTFQVDLPLDSSNADLKSKLHETGSTYSYGKRYLITMIFNIAIAKEDDDGATTVNIAAEKNESKDIFFYRKYMDAVFRNLSEVHDFREALRNDDLALAAGYWYDFSQVDQESLFLAPSKGGFLTTEQRKLLKSPDFRALRNMSATDEALA